MQLKPHVEILYAFETAALTPKAGTRELRMIDKIQYSIHPVKEHIFDRL